MDDFTDFYRRHRLVLLNYLVHLTGNPSLAMEIVQESFTRCLSRYGSQKSSRVLLFKIARNALIDEYRRQRRFSALTGDEHAADRNPERNVQIREEYERVLAVMETLEREEREILAMRVSSDLTYREIAGITGLNETNVRVRVHRARLKIKKFLDQGE